MRSLTLFAALFPSLAAAEPPRVVTDIAPVHSIVAQVMGELGAPQNLIDPSLSPHDAALKPSQAQLLQEAQLVIIIGDELTPWLPGRAKELAPSATQISLIEASSQLIEPGSDENGAEHDHDHDHGHDIDPHIWLSPENASGWLGEIATALGKLDPENAKQYQINANQALINMQNLDQKVNDLISPVRSKGYMVYHDAYSYFSKHYGMSFKGALTSNEGAPPSAADVQSGRDAIAAGEVVCFFTEPQFSPSVVTTVTDGLEVKVESLDLLGVDLAQGPELYGQLLTNMANSFRRCLN